mgnify:CR=1 FL=1
MVSVLVAVSLTLPPRAAMAAKAVTKAQAAEAEIVAKQALSFYFKGQFKIAAELYHQAFRINKTSPDYLYGAARAEHKVGLFEEAVRDYRQVLALFKPGEGLHTKAGFHLKEAEKLLNALKEKRALEVKAAEAQKAAEVQKAAKAAETQRANEQREAAAAALAKATAPDKAAVGADDEALPPLAPSVVEKAPETVAQTTVAGWQKPTGIGLASVGVLGLVGGGLMLAGAFDDQASLDANKKDGKFVTTADFALKDAAESQKDINAKMSMAAIVGAAGVVSAGVGAWFWFTAPQTPALAITPGRVQFSWRF